MTKEELIKDKDWLEKCVKREKRNVKSQTQLLTQLSVKFKEQNNLLKFKEAEVQELELKLIKYDALSAKNASTMKHNGLPSGTISEQSKDFEAPS